MDTTLAIPEEPIEGLEAIGDDRHIGFWVRRRLSGSDAAVRRARMHRMADGDTPAALIDESLEELVSRVTAQ